MREDENSPPSNATNRSLEDGQEAAEEEALGPAAEAEDARHQDSPDEEATEPEGDDREEPAPEDDCEGLRVSLDEVTAALKAVEVATANRDHKLDEGLDGLRRAIREQSHRTTQHVSDLMDKVSEQVVFHRLRSLILRLLSIADDLRQLQGAARGVTPEQHEKNYANLRTLLVSSLMVEGVTEVEPEELAPFDPVMHRVDAVLDTPEAEKHEKVANVVRSGFAYRDQTLRPAVVQVWRHVPGATPDAESPEDDFGKTETQGEASAGGDSDG